MFKRLLATSVAVAILISAALPAFAVGPGQTTLAVYPQYNTYAASVITLTPAASATDFFTITGSATKSIVIRRVTCTGVSTAAASQVISATLRSTADSGGTAVTAPTVASLNSAYPAATATVAAYTANPTLGTSAGIVSMGLIQTLAPASTGAAGIVFDYPIINGDAPVVLTGTTQQFALNAGGVSFAAGTALSCTALWTER